MKAPKLVKILGSRGSWVAKVEGQTLPVLHNSLWSGGDKTYRQTVLPQHRGGKRWAELLAALQSSDLVVMQRDMPPDKDVLGRAGYVGVFRFEGLTINEDDEFTLIITERYASPKP